MVKIPSNIEVSGFNFPIQFYENKDRAVFLGYDMILPYFTILFPGSRFVYLFWSYMGQRHILRGQMPKNIKEHKLVNL
jgi:hypothetical protein